MSFLAVVGRLFAIAFAGLVVAMIVFIHTHRVETSAVRGQRIGQAAATVRANTDGANLQWLGESAIVGGLASAYDLSALNASLDVTISSLLPGDARAVADIICTTARENFVWGARYEVRVFLPVSGDRPAAVCQI